MDYKLYAKMRDMRNIMICEHWDFNFLVSVADHFSESDHIGSFVITRLKEGKEVQCFEKFLEQKPKEQEQGRKR